MVEEKDIYDKRKIYRSKIAPLIKELKVRCNLECMPMFITVAVANSEEGTKYMNDAIHAGIDVTLKDDRISDVLLLLNGFESDMPEHIKRDLREVEDYADHLKAVKNRDTVDVSLKKDKIAMLDRAVECRDEVKPPDGILERLITDEFLDD